MAESSKIYALVGLPGSGKSTLAKKWAAEFKLKLIDDPKTATENKKEEVLELVRRGESFILCDIFLCDSEVRARFEDTCKGINSETSVHYYFFENRPDKCLANIKLRNDGRNVEPSLKRLSSIYTIPTTALPMTIWTGDSNEAN